MKAIKYNHTVIKPWTFEFYGTNVVEVGRVLATTKAPVRKEHYYITAGHGITFEIPGDHVRMIEVF